MSEDNQGTDSNTSALVQIRHIISDVVNLEPIVEELKTLQRTFEESGFKLTKNRVDNVREIVSNLKESINRIYDSFESSISLGDVIDGVNDINNVNQVNDGITSKLETIDSDERIGKIKLVDLSKLLAPSQNDDINTESVVILSDSESDSPTNVSIVNKKCEDSTVLNKSILKKNRVTNGVNNSTKTTPVKKVQFVEPASKIIENLSDSSDYSLKSSDSDHDDSQADGKTKRLTRRPTKNLIHDPKFNQPCSVLLEKLNLKRLDGIKRLRNMSSIKRKKADVEDDSSSSSTSSTSSTASSSSSSVKRDKKRAKIAAPKSSSSSSESESEADITVIDVIMENQCVAPDPKEALEALRDDDAENETQVEDDGKETEDLEDKKEEEQPENNEACGEETKKKKFALDSSEEEEDTTNATTAASSWKQDKLLSEKLSDSESNSGNKKTKEDETQSDTPSSEKKKKTKKKTKRVISDSEDSSKEENKSDDDTKKDNDSSSSTEEEEKKEDQPKKKSRKRIKRVKDSSDEEDKTTRKHIRKVLNKDSLADTTIQAEKAESERKARIAERQEKYNNIFDADKLESSTLSKVVLDFNEETEEELLRVDPEIVKHLKPHQGKGIKFMWDACFESVDRAQNTKGSGCILAHCMGLGKTLQVISLIHTLIKHQDKTKVHKVLVVCPLSTVLNWVAEFRKWLPNDDVVEVYDLVSYKQNRERLYYVMEWHRDGGVLVLGYDMFRNLSNETNKRVSKKMRLDFQKALVNPGPDLVVCDEGHLLKNEKTSISKSMNRLQSLRRIVLTGTPLQNNLREYFCMVQFVKPNLLGTYKEYLNRFVNPITNGQYTDSTPHDTQLMRKRSHVLHKMLDGIVERRDYSVLAPFLPPKYEYVVFVQLTQLQIKLYQHYLDEHARTQRANGKSSYLFIDFQEFQRICTHPRVLQDKSIQNRIQREKRGLDDEDEEESEGSLKDFIDDGTDGESSSDSSSGGEDSNEASSATTKYRRRTRAMTEELGTGAPELEELKDKDTAVDNQEWWSQFMNDDELVNLKYSGKLHLLFEILHQCELIGDKVLVFSQSLYSLNVIEYFLNKIDEVGQTDDPSLVCGYKSSWSLGLDYFRLDGSSSCDNRAAWCKTFNDPENTRARLFLISTRAGGLGINLVAANRVVIFDVSWNPSHDIQSIYRVYRFGQTKPSYIYRFVTNGTMEMKIYERQVTKQAISKRVIDEQQIDRHYNQNDLAELYKFEPTPEEQPTPLVPKDVLLGELLQNHKNLIFKYHEHQSLLENKEDEGLNEAERKAAWEEFENEKKARQYTAGSTVNNIPMHKIIQAITNITKRDHPTFTSAEISGVMTQLLAELRCQMAAGDMTMYNKILAEIRYMQVEEQRRLQEYYQQQQMIKLFQDYKARTGSLLTDEDALRLFQQQRMPPMPQRNMHPPFVNLPSNSAQMAPLTPYEVVSIDDD